MIISWNKNVRSILYIFGAIILLLSAVYVFRDHDQNMIDASSPAPVQQEADNGIEKLLSEQEADNYFAEYRMERERIRSKQVETLKDIINQESSTQEAKDAAALRLVKISEDIEKEMKTESLIKSRGYEDCVVIIQAETTTVVILAAALRVDQEEEIKKMVSRSVQCSDDSICIVAREK
ncbi:stage iii sporulation protein ah [hydrocarbon metagenome]|uniref:Stage iii sporulation protein ah n=1 Tax=hydrocarbon metagenome TaxID=938273 RepID=A0A0W8E934_9ZZZZ